jgi:hypothetical protein
VLPRFCSYAAIGNSKAEIAVLYWFPSVTDYVLVF